MTDQTHRQALPKGFMLQEYQLDRVLGAGGFGLTYLGWDTALDKAVAVKEYLPNDLAVREANHSVAAKSGDDEDNFRWGLARFLFEARTLARFKHPNIVQVHRCFEAHGTAYIVMEFVEGETFDAYLKRTGRPKESFLLSVITALLDGLAEVHRAGFMHRDIKPGNIILNLEGAPVLVDFGSARQEIGGKSRSITSVVTPGYAPIEQYSTRGKQGPWTDIYALGAVAYRAVTDAPPPDATERVLDDSIKPAVDAGRGNYSAEFLRAVDHALAVNSKDRLQDVDAWRKALAGDAPAKKPAVGKSESKPKQNGQREEGHTNSLRRTLSRLFKKNGRREERYADGSVGIGQYVNGKRNGRWEFQYANGRVDTGPYVEGKRHGQWKIRWAGGTVATGQYANGKIGQWEERYANGAVGIGQYVNGRRHSDWVLRFASGTVERGPFVDGKRHGHWVLRNADGDVQEGPFVDGKKTGHWVLRFANGNVYEGPYKDEERHGNWGERDADGTMQKGSYKDGKRHGHWVLRHADGGVHKGHYVDGKKQGYWIERYADGGIQEGSYKNSKPHGHWVLRSTDGGVQEGSCLDGKKTGHWVLRFANGNVYEGPYKDGKQHGQWVERDANGDVYEGPYNDGKKTGHWVWRYTNGLVREGPYKDGKVHGQWVWRHVNGKVSRIERFENGIRIDGKNLHMSDEKR